VYRLRWTRFPWPLYDLTPFSLTFHNATLLF
jgi:hypothetical protein